MTSPASAPIRDSVSTRCGRTIQRIVDLCGETPSELLGDYAPDSWGESAVEKLATAMNLVHQPASGISQAQLIDYIKKSADRNKGAEKMKVANKNTKDALTWVKSFKTSEQSQDSLSDSTGDKGTRSARNSQPNQNDTGERDEEPEEELEENPVTESYNRATNRDEHEDRSNASNSRVTRKRRRTTASTSFLADQQSPKRHFEGMRAINTTTAPLQTHNHLSDCVGNNVSQYDDNYIGEWNPKSGLNGRNIPAHTTSSFQDGLDYARISKQDYMHAQQKEQEKLASLDLTVAEASVAEAETKHANATQGADNQAEVLAKLQELYRNNQSLLPPDFNDSIVKTQAQTTEARNKAELSKKDLSKKQSELEECTKTVQTTKKTIAFFQGCIADCDRDISNFSLLLDIQNLQPQHLESSPEDAAQLREILKRLLPTKTS